MRLDKCALCHPFPSIEGDMELSGFSNAIFETTVIMVEKKAAHEEEKYVSPQTE
jgi:hypothetical protein